MSLLLRFLLFLSPQELGDPTRYQNTKSYNDLEFLDDFPLMVYGGSFYTFDTTSLSKQKFIFVVSATRIAYFKKGGRLVIVHHLKRESRQNGYMDFFEGSGCKIKLNVVEANRIGKSHIRYTGVLELAHNQNTTTIRMHGIKKE